MIRQIVRGATWFLEFGGERVRFFHKGEDRTVVLDGSNWFELSPELRSLSKAALEADAALRVHEIENLDFPEARAVFRPGTRQKQVECFYCQELLENCFCLIPGGYHD